MRRLACLVTVTAALLGVAEGAAARGRSTPPKEIALTAQIVRKVIACNRPVTAAEESARGGSGSFYQDRMRRRDAALARCGFPKGVVWRDAHATVRTAASDLDIESGLPELRAANRQVALPFRAQLAGFE